MSHLRYGAHVQANGIRQHYLRYGPAKDVGVGRDPVIVVPGITSPAVTWGFVAEQLAARLEVYVLDVRGRGLSEAGPHLDYGLDAQAADLNAFAAALGLARYSVLGHSMGARIAIRAAQSRPAGLARMVWVDPPVSGPGRRPYPAQLPWYIDSIRQARRGMSGEDMRAFCPTWTDEQRALRAQWLHTCDERAILASFSGFHEDAVVEQVAHVTCPTLLITAARGDVVGDEDVAEMQTLLPALAHIRVAEAGHMIPWDNAAGFYAALGDFLEAPTNDSEGSSHGGQ
ncbi:alpha/beta hydrolase [Pseudomonas sp. GD03842]|uniref:alpha/beta fold hydrolase n=1 Tax=Pseudomonas sp. GD03842 TaxID=2975385 RepID=UPI002447C96B|nr:alpha/beta hydrolase [Pseudomonas sp. GD03842]MDH0744860.1 alpha/beta hydrolase [Pseudomonas sp. GD03842]